MYTTLRVIGFLPQALKVRLRRFLLGLFFAFPASGPLISPLIAPPRRTLGMIGPLFVNKPYDSVLPRPSVPVPAKRLRVTLFSLPPECFPGCAGKIVPSPFRARRPEILRLYASEASASMDCLFLPPFCSSPPEQ